MEPIQGCLWNLLATVDDLDTRELMEDTIEPAPAETACTTAPAAPSLHRRRPAPPARAVTVLASSQHSDRQEPREGGGGDRVAGCAGGQVEGEGGRPPLAADAMGGELRA